MEKILLIIIKKLLKKLILLNLSIESNLILNMISIILINILSLIQKFKFYNRRLNKNYNNLMIKQGKHLNGFKVMTNIIIKLYNINVGINKNFDCLNVIIN